MRRLTSGVLASVTALLLAGAIGCAPDPITEPGSERRLHLRVKLAALSPAELDGIGSFTMTLLHDGVEATQHALSFNASARELRFLEEPEGLPLTGMIELRLRAHDFAGMPLAIGGRAGPLDLDTLPVDGEAELRTLIVRLGAVTSLSQTLSTARFRHSATALPGGGVLVVGGARGGDPDSPSNLADQVEWLNPWGITCATGDGGDCVFGEVPPARLDHVALALASGFAPDCPHAGKALIALGADQAGQPQSDAYLFDPGGLTSGGAFTRLDSLGLRARAGAVAVATRDCRVLIAGGVDSGGAPIAAIELLRFAEDGVTLETSAASLPIPGRSPGVAATRNALDEVIVFGGQLAGGDAGDGAVAIELGSGALDLCDLSQNACNGAATALGCGRAAPATASLNAPGQLASALIVGGDATGTCAGRGQVAELYLSSTEAPYHRFAALSAQPASARLDGVSATGLSAGIALITGGRDDTGATLDAIELFELAPGADPSQASVNSAGALSAPRAFHAVTLVERVALITGGFDGASARNTLEVFLAAF